MKTHIDIQIINNKVVICANDGIFHYSATFSNLVEFQNFCEDKADLWLCSTYGNFDGLTENDRNFVANKWKQAKYLEEGRYEYYFNTEDIQSLFIKEVKKLADSMDIKNYKLDL